MLSCSTKPFHILYTLHDYRLFYLHQLKLKMVKHVATFLIHRFCSRFPSINDTNKWNDTCRKFGQFGHHDKCVPCPQTLLCKMMLRRSGPTRPILHSRRRLQRDSLLHSATGTRVLPLPSKLESWDTAYIIQKTNCWVHGGLLLRHLRWDWMNTWVYPPPVHGTPSKWKMIPL